jgi:hypothetical protein
MNTPKHFHNQTNYNNDKVKLDKNKSESNKNEEKIKKQTGNKEVEHEKLEIEKIEKMIQSSDDDKLIQIALASTILEGTNSKVNQN